MEENRNVDLKGEEGKGHRRMSIWIHWGVYNMLKREFRFGDGLERKSSLSRLIKRYCAII